jgi:hypothetical protein
VSTCINHPERETRYHCSKHDIYLCEACLECRDPELYCKFRQSCPIWFMTRKLKHLGDTDTGATEKNKLAAGVSNPG